MFILVDNSTEGVYAVKAKDKSKIVQIFEKEDDAERYLVHLEAEDSPDKKNSNYCHSRSNGKQLYKIQRF